MDDDSGDWGERIRTITFQRSQKVEPSSDDLVTGTCSGLDLLKTEQDLLRHAANEGIDVDELKRLASVHFQSDDFSPRMSDLTEEEIRLLVEEELQASDD